MEKKLLAAVDVLGYFFWICNPDVGTCTPPSSWFEIIHCWPPLWSPPRQHGPAWMQIYSRIGIWGGIGIFDFSPNPLSHQCSFSSKLFHLARSNSPEHLLLLILLKTLQCWRFCSLLFFSRMSSSTLQPFSALQCKRSRMEDGWLKDGISFWLEAVFAVFPWLRLPTFRSFWCLFVCSLSSQSTVVRLTLLYFNKA